MLNLIDSHIAGFPLLFVGLFEIFAVVYIYGTYKVYVIEISVSTFYKVLYVQIS